MGGLDEQIAGGLRRPEPEGAVLGGAPAGPEFIEGGQVIGGVGVTVALVGEKRIMLCWSLTSLPVVRTGSAAETRAASGGRRAGAGAEAAGMGR